MAWNFTFNSIRYDTIQSFRPQNVYQYCLAFDGKNEHIKKQTHGQRENEKKRKRDAMKLKQWHNITHWKLSCQINCVSCVCKTLEIIGVQSSSDQHLCLLIMLRIVESRTKCKRNEMKRKWNNKKAFFVDDIHWYRCDAYRVLYAIFIS